MPTDEFKCPNCAGAITFDGSTQMMRCPYCDSEFDVEAYTQLHGEVDAPEAPVTWAEDEHTTWSEEEQKYIAIYSCQSCGGEIVGEKTMGATSCPFCGNPTIVSANFAGKYKPDYVVPFAVTAGEAKAALAKFYRGKPLLSKDFASANRIEEVRGIYVPFWLFSSDVDGTIKYRATKVRTWSDSQFDYTETSHFAVVRTGEIAFDNVPVDGSLYMPDALMESIEPYDYKSKTPFTAAFLAGYLADKYDVTQEQCQPRANQRITTSTEQAFRSTVTGYTTVTQSKRNLTLQQSKVSYAFMPVWLLNTTWKGKKYTFAMNGQTGKFVGDLPTHWGRAASYFGIIAGAVTAAAFIVQTIVGG